MATSRFDALPRVSVEALVSRLDACRRELEAVAKCVAAICGDGSEDMTTRDRVMVAVCDHYNVSANEIAGPSRLQNYAKPRHIACYLLRERARMTLNQIGAFLNRDHTTVIYSIGKARDLMRTDAIVASAVRHLEQVVDASGGAIHA